MFDRASGFECATVNFPEGLHEESRLFMRERLHLFFR